MACSESVAIDACALERLMPEVTHALRGCDDALRVRAAHASGSGKSDGPDPHNA